MLRRDRKSMEGCSAPEVACSPERHDGGLSRTRLDTPGVLRNRYALVIVPEAPDEDITIRDAA